MWIDENSLSYFTREFNRSGVLFLEDIPLPSQHFASEAGDEVVSLLIAKEKNGHVVILIPSELKPISSQAIENLSNKPLLRDDDGVEWLHLVRENSFERAISQVGGLLLLEMDYPESPEIPLENVGASLQTPNTVVIRRPRGERRVNERGGNNDPDLLQFGQDITMLAEQGKLAPVIGRENEITMIIQILLKAIKNNPCLLGEPGVGKTAVVEGLAQRIIKDEVPERLRGARVFALDLGAILSGASYKGVVEERINKILKSLNGSSDGPMTILFIDELHNIMDVRGDISFSELIKPYLARGMRLIGATTHSDWKRAIEPDKALVRRFIPVFVAEPSRVDTIKILNARLPEMSRYHGVDVSEQLIEEIVDLSSEYIPDRYQPDKALDLLDEAMALQLIRASLSEWNEESETHE